MKQFILFFLVAMATCTSVNAQVFAGANFQHNLVANSDFFRRSDTYSLEAGFTFKKFGLSFDVVPFRYAYFVGNAQRTTFVSCEISARYYFVKPAGQ